MLRPDPALVVDAVEASARERAAAGTEIDVDRHSEQRVVVIAGGSEHLKAARDLPAPAM